MPGAVDEARHRRGRVHDSARIVRMEAAAPVAVELHGVRQRVGERGLRRELRAVGGAFDGIRARARVLVDAEVVVVATQRADEAQAIGHVRRHLDEASAGALGDRVVRDVLDELAILGVVDADAAHAVVAQLRADVDFHRFALVKLVDEASAERPATIELVDLKVVGRVRDHVPVVVLHVGRRRPRVAGEHAVRDPAIGAAHGRVVERAEAVRARGRADGDLGALLRGVPRGVIAGQRHLEIAEAGHARRISPRGSRA